MTSVVLRIAGYGVRDLVRSRWLAAYTTFFFLATFALLRFSDSETKALLSIANVVLLIVPLANVVFGTMYLYASREFVELLLAQPIRRRKLFAGLYLGLAGPIAAGAGVGILGALLLRRASPDALAIGLMLALVAAALSAVFTAIAAAIAFLIDDRVRGLVLAIGVWLLLAVVYDAGVLVVASQLAEHPIERPMLAAMAANPIDLARLVVLTRFDVGALLGYTGALFQRVFNGSSGPLVTGIAVFLWVVLPLVAGARLFQRKDF
jgi:Cu-processing system permease protein